MSEKRFEADDNRFKEAVNEARAWLTNREKGIGTYGTPLELQTERWARAFVEYYDAVEEFKDAAFLGQEKVMRALQKLGEQVGIDVRGFTD